MFKKNNNHRNWLHLKWITNKQTNKQKSVNQKHKPHGQFVNKDILLLKKLI